jgi:hypothetical protein
MVLCERRKRCSQLTCPVAANDKGLPGHLPSPNFSPQTNVPGWVTRAVSQEKLEEAKQAAIDEQLEKLPAMDAEIAQKLTMKANAFEIVPVK